jgi:hypothetical protein
MKRIGLLAAVLVVAWIGVLHADVNSPWGINAHVPNNQVLDLVAQAGIGWVRLDFNWFTLEPERDHYNWGYMDSVVSNARARGLEIFATLAYTPAWANGTGNIADPPTDPNDWYDFVHDTVARYRGSIKYWGMWNEPNLENFFTGSGWQYREWILKPGAQAAKAADPSCFVLAPELAHLNSADWPGWMEEAMTAGGADYVDIITHHCYKGDTGWDTFDFLDEGAFHWPWDDPPLMDVLKDLGVDDRPVWLTEVGWTTAEKDDVSEADQAEYYHQLLWGVYERDYLHKVFPYEIIDDPTTGVPHWGIVHSNYVPKQAWYTYRDFVANPTDPGGSSGCGKAGVTTTKPDSGYALLLLLPIVAVILRKK